MTSKHSSVAGGKVSRSGGHSSEVVEPGSALELSPRVKLLIGRYLMLWVAGFATVLGIVSFIAGRSIQSMALNKAHEKLLPNIMDAHNKTFEIAVEARNLSERLHDMEKELSRGQITLTDMTNSLPAVVTEFQAIQGRLSNLVSEAEHLGDVVEKTRNQVESYKAFGQIDKDIERIASSLASRTDFVERIEGLRSEEMKKLGRSIESQQAAIAKIQAQISDDQHAMERPEKEGPAL